MWTDRDSDFPSQAGFELLISVQALTRNFDSVVMVRSPHGSDRFSAGFPHLDYLPFLQYQALGYFGFTPAICLGERVEGVYHYTPTPFQNRT